MRPPAWDSNWPMQPSKRRAVSAWEGDDEEEVDGQKPREDLEKERMMMDVQTVVIGSGTKVGYVLISFKCDGI